MMKLKKTEKLQIQNLRILTPTQEKARVLLAAVIPLRKFAWQLCGGIASPKPLVAGLYLWRRQFPRLYNSSVYILSSEKHLGTLGYHGELCALGEWKSRQVELKELPC